MKNVKILIFKIMNDRETAYLPARLFNLFILFLILFNTTLVILDTFDTISISTKFFFYHIDIAITVIFTIEYVLRIWTADLIFPDLLPAKARFKYARSFMAIIDLLAIVPFYLPYVFPFDFKVIRLIRIFRLIRILKLTRYTDALGMIGQVIRKKAHQLLSSVFVIMLLILVASIVMYGLEHDAQPDVFKNAFSGMWWAVSTLVTIGYGDIYPVTGLGKLLSSFIALLGVALIAVPTGIISAGFMETPDETKPVSRIGMTRTSKKKL